MFTHLLLDMNPQSLELASFLFLSSVQAKTLLSAYILSTGGIKPDVGSKDICLSSVLQRLAVKPRYLLP